MIVRAVLFALVATLLWVGLEHVIATHGALLLSLLLAATGIYFFGRYVGPKLPAYLGGDPVPAPPIAPDLEWELYLAVVRGDISEAQNCLTRGANPFASFASNHQPVTTDAKSCYEFARQGGGLGEFVALFEQHRGGT